jgi:hypothetical protein
MTLLGNVRIAPLTSQVVEAEIQGQSDEVAPTQFFSFLPTRSFRREFVFNILYYNTSRRLGGAKKLVLTR